MDGMSIVGARSRCVSGKKVFVSFVAGGWKLCNMEMTMHPDYGKIKIAVNHVHYELERGLYITTHGLMTLTMAQRAMISKTFHAGKLGETFTFPMEVTEYAPEELAEEEAADAEEEADDEVMAEEDQGRIEREADFTHDSGRDDAAMGIDSTYARLYRKMRERG